MELKGYEVNVLSEDGTRVYCIVEMADGTSFGQWVDAGSVARLDAQIAEQFERVKAAAAAPAAAPILVGLKRDAAQIQKPGSP